MDTFYPQQRGPYDNLPGIGNETELPRMKFLETECRNCFEEVSGFRHIVQSYSNKQKGVTVSQSNALGLIQDCMY